MSINKTNREFLLKIGKKVDNILYLPVGIKIKSNISDFVTESNINTKFLDIKQLKDYDRSR